jgi:hypothetical protein
MTINFKRLDELKAAQARQASPHATRPKTMVELAVRLRRARTREELLELGPELDRLTARRFRKRLLGPVPEKLPPSAVWPHRWATFPKMVFGYSR